MNSELGHRECDGVVAGQGYADVGHGGSCARTGAPDLHVLHKFLSYYKVLMKKKPKRMLLSTTGNTAVFAHVESVTQAHFCQQSWEFAYHSDRAVEDMYELSSSSQAL
jgi:hypothetical protein